MTPGINALQREYRDMFLGKAGLEAQAHANRIMLETGYGLHSPSPVRGGVDLRGVTLSDGRNAYDVLQEYIATPPQGPALKSTLARLIQSPAYDTLVDGDPTLNGTKLGAIADVVRKYREASYGLLLRRYPEVRQLVSQGQLNVRSEILSKKAEARQGRPDVHDLLRSLGR